MHSAGSDARELGMNDLTANRDLKHERSGIYFAENKKYIIENRILEIMSEFGTTSYFDRFHLTV